MTKRESEQRAEAAEYLRGLLSPGDTVNCILRHVSRSGMLRVIELVTAKHGHIGYQAAVAMGDKWDDSRQGIRVGGCGMDMGFHLVYNLGYALWPDGYGCIGEGCRSNDHSNGDRDYTRHCDGNHTAECVGCGSGRAHWHRDGGYALRSEWL